MSRRDASARPAPDELLLVGRVGKPHGVRGELKVIPETDDPARFEDLATLFIGPSPAEAAPHGVEGVRFQQTKRGLTVLVRLDGVASVEAASALRRQEVYAREADLPPLGDDEFFLHDLVGLDVYTDAHEAPLGTVRDVLDLPMHPVLVVARRGQPDVLVPAVPEFLDEVDLDAGRLVVRPIEGLIE